MERRGLFRGGRKRGGKSVTCSNIRGVVKLSQKAGSHKNYYVKDIDYS
jgi:hypothetical protein